ncbi:MAG: hypothetical protein ACRD26_21775 [Vicinamibacterales bacterium]
MAQLDMLRDRLCFAGIPASLVGALVADVSSGKSWYASCRPLLATCLAAARRARGSERASDAARLWRDASALCQAASLDVHTTSAPGWTIRRTRRLRGLAARSFQRACDCAPELATRVQIGAGGARGGVTGYFQQPARWSGASVVLLNGLDSVCECELQAFSRAFLERDLATLSLDVPGAYAAGLPQFDTERLSSRVADWLARRGSRPPYAAFGVSFGAQLAARLLSGDDRFHRGVLVSPNAWFEPLDAMPPRLARMLAVTLGREVTQLDLDATRIDRVSPPRARLLLVEMTRDELFGRQHGDAYEQWATGRLERVCFDAEHVGTSVVHQWLPLAAEWLTKNVGVVQ